MIFCWPQRVRDDAEDPPRIGPRAFQGKGQDRGPHPFEPMVSIGFTAVLEHRVFVFRKSRDPHEGRPSGAATIILRFRSWWAGGPGRLCRSQTSRRTLAWSILPGRVVAADRSWSLPRQAHGGEGRSPSLQNRYWLRGCERFGAPWPNSRVSFKDLAGAFADARALCSRFARSHA